MSLHLGNLSSRTRRDDLERVFQRFGTCTIQVKDKYGFVVYDYPASAEKALKTLRGKRICGEAISLSWSKMQPRAPCGSARGGKAYEPPRRKQPVKEHIDRRLGSNNQRDYEMESKQPDSEGRKLGFSSDLIDESTSHHLDDSKAYVGERDHTAANGKSHLEDLEFDRYEPNHSDDRKESDEHKNKSPLENPDYRNSQKPRNTCYVCGEVGHKMHACASHSKRHVSRPQGRLVNGSETLTSENHGKSPRHQDSSTLPISPRGKRKEFRDKKRNGRDYKAEGQNHAKRSRAAPSSSFQSDYTLSRPQSPSRSLESLSVSPSHSKLKKKYPSSSRPSTSRHSEHEPFRSMSPAFSPSPVKGRNGSKVSMLNTVSHDLFEGETMVRTGTSPVISENVAAAMENECEARLDKLEDKGTMKDDEHCHSISRGSCEVSKSNVPQLDDGDNTADTSFHQSMNETRYSDFSSRSNISNPATFSSEEMCMVLKHYGLPYPDETERDLPVEIYLGSARLWPWEIIYYRRLRKGPISAENYARRVAQNKEFGIVDKYIRGSSGWGDQNESNL